MYINLLRCVKNLINQFCSIILKTMDFWYLIVVHVLVQFKQGHALKNWVEGLSDEAYYHKIKF